MNREPSMLSLRGGPVIHLRSPDAGSIVAVPDDDGSGSYPGGKSGAGVYQRIINLIPRHRILISAFAGHCGIVRNIKPAEHTVVIDADPDVCQWWYDWRRGPEGRALEIHNCDSIEWLRFRFGLTKYSAAGSIVAAGGGTAATPYSATGDEAFIFADPPYVLSERSHGKQYAHELYDEGHGRLLEVLTRIPATSAAVMACGYNSPIYASLEPWRSIDHSVPTRGGLQDERIWMNYPETDDLHDFQYVGDSSRVRERIRRRQKSWLKNLNKMGVRERAAMLAVLNEGNQQ